jgi:hypothetical protein
MLIALVLGGGTPETRVKAIQSDIVDRTNVSAIFLESKS